jgi:hypothetical protein
MEAGLRLGWVLRVQCLGCLQCSGTSAVSIAHCAVLVCTRMMFCCTVGGWLPRNKEAWNIAICDTQLAQGVVSLSGCRLASLTSDSPCEGTDGSLEYFLIAGECICCLVGAGVLKNFWFGTMDEEREKVLMVGFFTLYTADAGFSNLIFAELHWHRMAHSISVFG